MQPQPDPSSTLPPVFDCMPGDLTACRQWVLWKLEQRGGRLTKVPYQVNGRRADITHEAHWSSFEQVVAAYSAKDVYQGVGFVLTADDPFVAIDLDKCVGDDGTPVPWAQGIIDEIDSYTEWSPSGRGVRIIARGELGLEGNRRGQIEVYSQERYVTITGQRMWDDYGTTVEERSEQVARFQARLFGDRPSNVVPLPQTTLPTRDDVVVIEMASEDPHWSKLYAGDDSEFEGDASQGDHVFCKILARVTGDDDQIDRIYRTSKRYRDKWDSRRGGSTYGANTIVAARLSVLSDGQPGQVIPVGIDGFEYNDLGNAMRLMQGHQNELRWVEEWNSWLVYDQDHWVRDHRNARVEHMASLIADPLLEHIGPMRHDPKRMKAFMAWYNQTRSGFGMAATVRVARTLPEAMTSFKQLDQHPWLLNTLGRTIDLSNGYARDPDPADLLTKCAGVQFDPKATHVEWSRFLERIIPDPEVRLYVQCLAGLSLLGEPQELLPILWGDGANGKSTLTEVMALVLGDYAVKVSHDLLSVQKQQVHPTAKADLLGVRFAHSGELDGTDRLNEALVKELTGGDTIKARRMYEDFWEFKPSHLMWLHSNYRPRITGTDTGIWRRVKLIPFEVQIPKDERVDGLKWKLFANEGSGILNWMLAGLAAYKTNGDRLPEPPAVVEATSEYRTEADTVGQFIEASGLAFGPDLWCKASTLDMAHAMWFGSSAVRYTSEAHSKMVKVELRKRGAFSKQRKINGKATQVWEGCGFPETTLDLGS